MSVERVVALFERFGHDTVSSQALEPDLSYWFDGDDACVAYRDTGSAWVAAGGPICARDKRERTMCSFADAATEAGRRVRFFAIESDSESFASVKIGEQPEWNPARWRETLASKSSLREQLRRARAKGVTIREVSADELEREDGELHRQVCRMIRDWQKNRGMAPMSFLVTLDLFGNAALKRYFVAEQQGRVVAVLVASRIPARQGWFLRDVLRAHDAPNGTIELLFDHAMREAERQGIMVVSYGLAPLSGDVARWLRLVRDHSRWLYDFEGLRAFKAKLSPNAWRPVFLSFPNEERGIRATIDSLTAFAGGSWVRFGLRTVVHAQPTLIWWLALLLLPWTALLAQAPVAHWFPSANIRAAWIFFDVILFAGLLRLALDWRRRTAQLMALLAIIDSTLGIVQLYHFNQHHLQASWEWLLAIIAIVAPLGAGVILATGARLRDRLYLSVPRG